MLTSSLPISLVVADALILAAPVSPTEACRSLVGGEPCCPPLLASLAATRSKQARLRFIRACGCRRHPHLRPSPEPVTLDSTHPSSPSSPLRTCIPHRASGCHPPLLSPFQTWPGSGPHSKQALPGHCCRGPAEPRARPSQPIASCTFPSRRPGRAAPGPCAQGPRCGGRGATERSAAQARAGPCDGRETRRRGCGADTHQGGGDEQRRAATGHVAVRRVQRRAGLDERRDLGDVQG